MTDIMKFIRRERHIQEIPQEELASAIHVHHASICSWENYRYTPRFEDVENMLNYLGYEIVLRKRKVKENGKSDSRSVCK